MNSDYASFVGPIVRRELRSGPTSSFGRHTVSRIVHGSGDSCTVDPGSGTIFGHHVL